MNQITLSELEHQRKRRKTRREQILKMMALLIPWTPLEKKIRRHYPKAGRGRHAYPQSFMLRMHCVQLFSDLGDQALEDMLYSIGSVRRFVSVKITGPIPAKWTILKFRYLLESHGFGTKPFDVISQHFGDQGLMLKEGSIVDASVIAAPSSMKNRTGTRDPEMLRAQKGNQRYFD